MSSLIQGMIVSSLLMMPSTEALAQSEQEAIQAVALRHYLGQYPPSSRVPLCLAVSGHQAPTQGLRALLRDIKLDADKNCHFREGGLVYSATRVALTSNGLAELEVSKLEFGHVSTYIQRIVYWLQKGQSWQVVSAKQAVQ